MPATSIAGDQMRGRLQQLGLGAERTIVAIIWAHGPLLAAAAALAGNDVLITLVLWLAVALCATLAHRLNPATTATHVTVAAAFCLMPALLLRALDGHPWQVDAHMHFFAVLAVCASMLDVWAVLAGAAVVAVHHLLLNFIYSTMLFPGGADLGRVVFHAVILIFEAAALFWLVRNTAHALVAAEQASAEITRHDEERQVAEALMEQSRADDRRQALREMADTVEETTRDVVDSLRNEAEEMVLQANMMADLTVSVSQDADVAARSAAEALANADAVTETSAELQSSIELITTRIGRAGEITQSAVISGTTAANMIALLSDATDRIGAVVQLIDSIAKQTNLLALNATIEAARAGDAGKGFAVVASEVKELANQTGRSTGEISRQVNEIREQTAAAVAVVRDVGKSLEEIAVVSASIAEAVGQQAQITLLIARNVHENADSVRALSAAITSVSSQASISGEQSDAVRMSSVSMSSNVSGMCSRILATIRGSITDLNRRVAPRGPVDLPCVIAMFGVEHAGRMVEMSTGGCRLSPSHFVSDGAATIRFNAGGKTLSVPCVMAMDQPDGTCRAVFDSATLTDQTRDAIATMLLRQAA